MRSAYASNPKNAFLGAVMAWRTSAQAGLSSPAVFDQFADAIDAGQAAKTATFVSLFHTCEKARDPHCVLLNALVLDEPGYLKRALNVAAPAQAAQPNLKLGVALARASLAASTVEENPQHATVLLKAASDVFATQGFGKELGEAQLNLALAAYLKNDFKQGDNWLARGKVSLSKAGFSTPSRYDEMAAKSRLHQKDYATALRYMQQAAAKAEKEKDFPAQVRTLAASASLMEELRRSAEGVKLLNQAITLVKTRGSANTLSMAGLLEKRGQLLAASKRLAEARRDFFAAHQIYTAKGEKSGAAGALQAAATLTYQMEGMKAALPLFQKAMSLDPDGVGKEHALLTRMAQGLADQNHCPQAMPLLVRAKKLSEKAKDGDVASLLLQKIVTGRCLRAAGKNRQATEEFNSVLQVTTLLGLKDFTAMVQKYGKGLKLNTQNPLELLAQQLSSLSQDKAASGAVAASSSQIVSGGEPVSGSREVEKY